MRRTLTFGGLAAALAGALAAGALVVPASGVEPSSTTPTVQYEPAGLLALRTGGTDDVRLDTNADGRPEGTQTLTAGAQCALTTSGQSLLKFGGYVGTATGNKISFASDSIGVAEKSSGTSCYQVNAPLERMVLELDKSTVKTALGSLVASSAYLDVELKQGARILATASLNGVEKGVFELVSGSSIGLNTSLDPSVFVCNTQADSGPDAGIKDNCRWPISAPSWLSAQLPDDGIFFDKLVLESKAGSFSLEGGSDGAIPNAYGIAPPLPPTSTGSPSPYTGNSLFELAAPAKTGDLACNSSTVTIEPTSTSPGVTVDRLANVGDPDLLTCEKVPYRLQSGDGYAQFLKPLDSQGNAQFVITMKWQFPASNGFPIPPTKVDYETPVPGTLVTLGWCPDPLYSTSDSSLIGISNPPVGIAAFDQDPDPAGNGTQFSCIGSEHAEVLPGAPGQGDDLVEVTQEIYVLGDILLRK